MSSLEAVVVWQCVELAEIAALALVGATPAEFTVLAGAGLVECAALAGTGPATADCRQLVEQ